MASQALRTICMGYKDLNGNEGNKLLLKKIILKNKKIKRYYFSWWK